MPSQVCRVPDKQDGLWCAGTSRPRELSLQKCDNLHDHNKLRCSKNRQKFGGRQREPKWDSRIGVKHCSCD